MRAGHARSAAADQTRSCRRFTPATLPGVRGLPTSALARSDDTDRAFVRRPIDRDWRGRKHRRTDDGCSYQDRFAPGRSPSKEYEVNNRRSAIQVTRSDRQFDLKQHRPMVAFWKFTVTETEVPERFPYPGLVRCDLFLGATSMIWPWLANGGQQARSLPCRLRERGRQSRIMRIGFQAKTAVCVAMPRVI